MIEIKNKSQLERSFFFNYNKFNLIILLKSFTEFIFFLYNHFKYKYFSRHITSPRNFYKKKIIQYDSSFNFKKFTYIKFKKIKNPNTLRFNNNIYFNNLDAEKNFNQIRYYFLLDFVVFKINSDKYYKKFIRLYKKDRNKLYFKKDIYSASERLSNLIIFLCYQQYNNYNFDDLKKIIISHIDMISTNIEYQNPHTNNHILNNFRSLILASIFINNKELLKSSLINFIKFYPLVFNKEGQIKEGSSHYHLLIHNWIEDIYYFIYNSHFKSDIHILNNLKKIFFNLKKVRYTSNFFYKLYINGEINIGDTSPDLHPKFIINKISKLYSFKFNDRIQGSKISNNWSFYNNNKISFISTLSKSINREKNLHHHNDLTSFVLIYNFEPIVIDLGRYNYTKNNISLYHQSSYSHNCLFVNGLGLYPQFFYKNFLPREYFCNIIKSNSIIKTSKSFKIITKGFNRYNLLSRYSRKFSFKNNSLLIEDEIFTSSNKEIKLVFNLGKKLIPISHNHNSYKFLFDKKKTVIFDFSNNNIEINLSIKKTILTEIYGKKIPTNQLFINFITNKNLKFYSKVHFN